jgi:YesN/AraC family two-component response regulator
MELRTVLVDDEQLARDELGYLLSQVDGVEVIGQAGNGVEALDTIDRLQPDLVFLDARDSKWRGGCWTRVPHRTSSS